MPKNTKSFLICAHRINVSSKGKNGKNWKWSSLKSSQQPVKKIIMRKYYPGAYCVLDTVLGSSKLAKATQEHEGSRCTTGDE